MVPLLTSTRGLIGVGGLLGLLLVEQLRPFRHPVDQRARRYATNLFITGSNTLVLSVLLSGVIVGAYQRVESFHVGLLHRLGIGSWWNAFLTVAWLDGVTYVWHRAYHGVPLMWRMHRVHHSDLDLDVTTSGRFHLTEMGLSALFRLGVIALWGPTVAGVVLFEIVFGLFNQLEHANLQFPESLDRRLRWIFVTPAMHRVHHSQRPEHTNSNYSTIFSWWDRLFGTYRVVDEQRALTIGLPDYPGRQDVTFGKVLAMPFGPPCRAGRRTTLVKPVPWPVMCLGVFLTTFLGAQRCSGQTVKEARMDLQLTSAAFGDGQWIPSLYTCESQDISPPLSWTAPPPGTKSFALIVDDPDAPNGRWVHWIVYDLPATVRQLPEAFPSTLQLPDGTRQGTTDFGRTGYGGPCPPSGTHRYVFTLYAVETMLSLPAGATVSEVEHAMENHVLAHARLVGTYRRTGR
ncbi:MAG: YbhB/YbcL family Raf kinase inhibitor-like protein [Candidatus Omnitrophica bacterium]|nr:YbhB/YbcL family Raf kinase inhibitor-like protein [Candidatus Omnitrophota bacterium]